jgi:hypothetical protein
MNFFQSTLNSYMSKRVYRVEFAAMIFPYTALSSAARCDVASRNELLLLSQPRHGEHSLQPKKSYTAGKGTPRGCVMFDVASYSTRPSASGRKTTWEPAGMVASKKSSDASTLV